MNDQTSSDTRRIQTTGRGSYIVSLPKRWVSEMGLSKGERLVVTRKSDGSLSLVPKELEKKRMTHEIELQIRHDADGQSIVRRLVSFYLVGYDSIRITFEKAESLPIQLDALREFVRKKLMGTEIITETSNEMLLQVLLSYPQLATENALKRMAAMAEWMHKEAVKAFRERNQQLAEEVVKMDDEVDRFGFYIVRQIKTALRDPQIIQNIGLKSAVDCLGYRLVVKSVERIADHGVMISKYLTKGSINKTLDDRIQKMSDLASLTFESALSSLYSRNYQMADKVFSKTGKIESLETEIVGEISKSRLFSQDLSNVRLVLESLKRIAEYGNDIAEVVLNLTAIETSDALS
jgi:phosphate uptake regulator